MELKKDNIEPLLFTNTNIYCEVCGRPITRAQKIYGKKLCSKHMHQIFKYGYPIDNNPRTENDLNGFRFYNNGKIVEFDCYDKKQNVVGHFYIDSIDLQRIRYKKWRIDTNNRVITGNCTNKNPRRELSRLIMNIDDDNLVVDHINGNPFDNTRSNLRICTQSQNMMNRHYMSNNRSGIIGVCWDKQRRRWAPEITINNKKIHLGRYQSIEEAKYVRYIAEKILFKEFQCYKNQNFDHLSNERKIELESYVNNKISEKLWQ